MRRLLLAISFVLSGLAPLFLQQEAAGACGDLTTVGVGTQPGAFNAHVDDAIQCNGSEPQGEHTSTGPEGTWKSRPQCVLSAAQTCGDGEVSLCGNGEPMMYVWFETTEGQELWGQTNCPGDPLPTVPAGPTLVDIQNAFRALPMKPSVLQVQPPGGETLVNFRTNFFTVNDPFERSVTLLGVRVDFKIRPSEFTWHFGDGESRTTTKPGAAYPALDVTHSYARKGTVRPRVDTTYTADYRVEGGPWQPVDATVTIPGAAVRLTIREARPVLVG